MNHYFKKFLAMMLLLILAAVESYTVSDAAAKATAFSFNTIWFYREGTKVVPAISKRWLTVVFHKRYLSTSDGLEATSDTEQGFIRKKARAIMKSNNRVIDYFYDPNLAEDACFFRMRNGLKPEDIIRLINQLSQDGTVRYVHPTLVLDNKTLAYFDAFEMEWKTGTSKEERESLLSAAHVVPAENNEKENRYLVDIKAIPFFKAINLLAEDIRVLRVTPYLVEVKPSIVARLSLFMSGGNVGDSIPFTLTITFSDRVSIDPSSIAALNLRPQELQKELFECIFDPYDYAKAVSKSPIVITGRLTFYAPGEFTVPPIKISYSCPSCSNSAGNNVRSIETEPVLFKVSSIIPADKTEYRLIVPADPVSPDSRLAVLHEQSQRFLWFALICFAGLVPCAIWLLLLRRKATGERKRLKKRINDAQLAEQLRTLLQTTPTVPHWSYLGEIGALLREYMVAHYGIDSIYQGGSGKQFIETVRANVPEECMDALSRIFTAIDNSVALELEHYEDIDRLQPEILKIVDLVAQSSVARE